MHRALAWSRNSPTTDERASAAAASAPKNSSAGNDSGALVASAPSEVSTVRTSARRSLRASACAVSGSASSLSRLTACEPRTYDVSAAPAGNEYREFQIGRTPFEADA